MAGDGLVDPRWWAGQQDSYLAAATAVVDFGSPLNLIDHLEWRRRHPDHVVDVERIDAAALERWFVRIDGWLDCADFDVLRLLQLRAAHGDALPAAVSEALDRRLADFRYWYTEEPAPPVVDQRWYWSENHRLIFHTVEHLAGAALADTTFRDGASGATHRDRAAGRLQAWFDEKARWGFSEWHSDVYYEKDLAPLLLLVEWSDDDAIRDRAHAMLDLLLFDVAVHLHRGNFGATHGRSYMKDKSRAEDQPMFGAAKLCFGDSDRPWPVDRSLRLAGRGALLPRNEGATLLAAARRYRPPEVLRRIATSTATVVDRERSGLVIDPDEPFSSTPSRADGLSWDDPEMVPFWWDRSALTTWQLVPSTMDTLDRYDLWEADLFAPIRPVRDLTGGDRNIAQRIAHALRSIINAGLLSEVNTYTYRTDAVMLSTAQSYRPGRTGYQQHVWQATLDEDAVVFTTHPANEPMPAEAEYADADHYWTGSATLPRSAQIEGVGLHLYAPAFASPDDPTLAGFAYLPATHAWFPTERFDEVVRADHWTFGRRGSGYVGLWSWRPVDWRHHDDHPTGLTEPFDLVAAGGAENVWIVEVGDGAVAGGFTEWCAALQGADPEVDDLGPGREGHLGFRVRYRSPSVGELAFASDAGLTRDGEDVPLARYPRFDNPWTTCAWGATELRIRDGDWELELDLATGRRAVRGPGS